MNLDWFVGFMEGEASFGASPCRRKTGFRLGWTFSVKFKINLAEHDREVLYESKKFLEAYGIIANIYYITPHKEWSQNASPQYILQVSGAKNCIKIFKLVFPKLELKRRKKQIKAWGEALLLIYETRGYHKRTKKDFIKIMEKIDEMRRHTHSHRQIKFTSSYFRKLWNIK